MRATDGLPGFVQYPGIRHAGIPAVRQLGRSAGHPRDRRGDETLPVRQVADEANRIRDKHLFTLTPGDVTHPKLAQLDELHIHLVMPKVVKESYDDLIQGETMTFSRFIEEIQGLQADRPQSLTLL